MTQPTTKTTAAKLQIKDGYTVRLIGGEDTATLLGPLPTGTRVANDDTTTADAALLFAADKAELDQQLHGVDHPGRPQPRDEPRRPHHRLPVPHP